MRKIIYYITIAMLVAFVSCDLNEEPASQVTEGMIGGSGDGSIKDRAAMLGIYNSMYSGINGGQEFWHSDFLVNTETHADNAYAGAAGLTLSSLEGQSQNSLNFNLNRDWGRFLVQVAAANRIISNIDGIKDDNFPTDERQQWKAEALIWRAWMYFDMVRLWGGVPLITKEAPAINNENFDAVYPLLVPPRNSVSEVYAQIVEDLTEALKYAPEVNAGNKQFFSKAVANALLAKVYAEQPIRDYNKTISYCEAVEKDAFALMPNFSDLFSVNEARTDVNYRNTKESIFELVYNVGNGNWVTWMFGIDLCDPGSTYNWEKWVTPSRDLIKAFENEGDNIRMNQAIVWGNPSWSNHYPSSHYPFMYKTRSRYNSIIKLRLADILLLKAEAYVAIGNLPEAAKLVNKIRARVELPELSNTVTASAPLMKEAVLKERRLELAFEGKRWFDLVRNGVVLEVMNTLNSRDRGRTKMTELTEERILFPIPKDQILKNPSLTQNPGY